MLTIRLAASGDAEKIADFSRRTFYETFAPYNSKGDMRRFMEEQFSQQLLIEEVGSKDNIFFIAFDQEENIAGYVRLRENNNPPELHAANAIEIARIYAAKHLIGKGVGRLLMQKSIDTAIQKKINTLWLGVWERNQKAIDFYRQWGFEKFGTHLFVLGNDAQTDWLMKKTLFS